MKSDTSLFFARRSFLPLRIIFVVALSIALMSIDHRTHRLDSARSLLETLLYPLQIVVDMPLRLGRWTAEQASTRSRLLAENERLRERHLRSSARLSKLAELEAENRRLRELLASPVEFAEKVLVAELITVGMDPFLSRLVINKGSADGVVVGQSLIDSQGVMGQVMGTGLFSSTALLITDPGHALPVQVQRNGLQAVAVGGGPLDFLLLSHIPKSADVQVGDRLVTSGLGGRFPSGYPVGEVVSVSRDPGQTFADVRVRPSALLGRNREVLLVWREPIAQEQGTQEISPIGERRGGR
ncbi:MAG: rod shape-determining protein MreC [Ectothiorhodospiraceae bacterium AqS1]|nr:rod shape-determining protein MreC [Ectothiorhodospiraceae bacterium AqS1]MBF2759661.1 rod shape-determining protein MreC [Ectothiorhodospiraceae bacterium AqS1]